MWVSAAKYCRKSSLPTVVAVVVPRLHDAEAMIHLGPNGVELSDGTRSPLARLAKIPWRGADLRLDEPTN